MQRMRMDEEDLAEQACQDCKGWTRFPTLVLQDKFCSHD